MNAINYLILSSLAFLNCQSPTKEEDQGKLIWSDEFDKTGVPDATKWDYDLGDGCPNVCN